MATQDSAETAPRSARAIVIAIVLLVLGPACLAASLYMAFVLDNDDAYGEVSIPGSARLHLPAGELDVGLRTEGAEGVPVPPLWLTVEAPDGVPGPVVIDAPRRRDQVDNGERVRVWVVRTAQDADYDITATGNVHAGRGWSSDTTSGTGVSSC